MTAGAGRQIVFLSIDSEFAGHSNHSFKYVNNFRNATCPFLNRFPFFQEFRFLRAKPIIFVSFVNPVRKIRVSEVLLEATHTQNDHRGLNRSPGPQLVIFYIFFSDRQSHQLNRTLEALKYLRINHGDRRLFYNLKSS